MIQIVERQQHSRQTYRENDLFLGDLELGAGQEIEQEMAQALNLKIFRLEQCKHKSGVRYGARLSHSSHRSEVDEEGDEEMVKELWAKVHKWKTAASDDNCCRVS